MSKEDILKANGTYNRSHDKVTAEKFLTGGFYDPMDIIQVKYEMIREALESPHRNITELASSYGFSRASFYKIKEAYEKNGVQALVPSKSGPRQAHKLTAEHRFFIDDHPKASSEEIRLRLQKERGLTVSRRTIERYRSRKKSC